MRSQVFSQSVRILKVFQCVPGLRRQAHSQQAGQEGRQTPRGSSVKILPSLLNGWVKFMTATSLPSCWKVLTSTNPAHFKDFDLHTVAILNLQAYQCFHYMWVSFSPVWIFHKAEAISNAFISHTASYLLRPDTSRLLFPQSMASAWKGWRRWAQDRYMSDEVLILKIIKWRQRNQQKKHTTTTPN